MKPAIVCAFEYVHTYIHIPVHDPSTLMHRYNARCSVRSYFHGWKHEKPCLATHAGYAEYTICQTWSKLGVLT